MCDNQDIKEALLGVESVDRVIDILSLCYSKEGVKKLNDKLSMYKKCSITNTEDGELLLLQNEETFKMLFNKDSVGVFSYPVVSAEGCVWLFKM